MEDCSPRECDHHCARVCRQYLCSCNYEPAYTSIRSQQRVCCKWGTHLGSKYKCVYTEDDPECNDVLTRYFGIARSQRNPHDPIRFTGVNHIPRFLHSDLTSSDTDYSNILKEREVMFAAKQPRTDHYYQFRSIRPYNKTNHNWYNTTPRHLKLGSREYDTWDKRWLSQGPISAQALSYGQMAYLS